MKSMYLILFLVCFFVFNIPMAFSEDSAGGDCGILYGEGYSFGICAPKGWVFDDQSGVSQGLPAVFYPEGKSWQDSSVVMYVNWAPKSSDIKNIKDLVQLNLDRFKEKGSKEVRATFIDRIENENKHIGEFWEFSGDKWGNSELLCYYEEENGIVMIVLSSRTKTDFDSSRDAFVELVRSYFYITEDAENKGAMP